MEETIKLMEADANRVLQYMASNGLVANAKKTSFLLLNSKKEGIGQEIRVGKEVVTRDSTATLLGIQFQDGLQWKTQIFGKGGVLSSLNSRLYILRRLKTHLSKKSALKMVDGIFTSKIRYGLQLLGRVRLNKIDPVCNNFKEIQLIQNKLLRSLNGSSLKDMISTESLLAKYGMLSVNQLNAQVKLLEMWKSMHVDDYPLKIKQRQVPKTGVSTRAAEKRRPIEIGKTKLTQNSRISDSIRIWNQAPENVTNAQSLYQAKKNIKSYVKSLPV